MALYFKTVSQPTCLANIILNENCFRYFKSIPCKHIPPRSCVFVLRVSRREDGPSFLSLLFLYPRYYPVVSVIQNRLILNILSRICGLVLKKSPISWGERERGGGGRDRQTERQRQTDRQRHRERERGRETERETETETDRQTDTERDRQRDRDRQIQTDRQTDRDTDRQGERERQTDRQTETGTER